MQKGFATLEIVLVIFIVGVLASCAVPNAIRVLDMLSLDYETKRLYSELRFLQATSRSTKVNLLGMGQLFQLSSSPEATLVIDAPQNGIHSWQIVRGLNSTGKPVREPHVLSNGVKILFRNAINIRINCDEAGKFKFTGIDSNSDKTTTITLKSRLGKEAKIVFDSVGRMRGDKS